MRFAHIDGMRAVAVLLVVLAHAGLGHVIPGGSGVTLFFTVSGFIITFLLLRERDKTSGFSAKGFYFRRAVKIFPPFAVIVLVPTLVWAIFNPVSWVAFGSQIFFVFNWAQLALEQPEILPGSGVVWSLAIEEQFYIVFAVIWLAFVKASWWKAGVALLAATAIVIATGLRLLLAGAPGSSDRIYFGTDTRMDGIAIGVLGALLLHAWYRGGGKSTWYARLLGSDATLVVSIVLFLISVVLRDDWFRDTFRFTLQSMAAILAILYGMFTGESVLKKTMRKISSWRPIALLGLASYSIYLAHLSVNQLLIEALDTWPSFARIPVLCLAGIAVGVTIYYLVEVPALRWRNRVRRPISE